MSGEESLPLLRRATDTDTKVVWVKPGCMVIVSERRGKGVINRERECEEEDDYKFAHVGFVFRFLG